jgi:hypothetical protein
VINETRVQFMRSRLGQFGDNAIPTLSVLDSFTGGGAQIGQASNRNDSIEVHNLTSIMHGTHMIKFGGRVRSSWLTDISPNNFGGNFTFAGGMGPQLDANNQAIPARRSSSPARALSPHAAVPDMGLLPTRFRSMARQPPRYRPATPRPGSD